MTKIIFNATDAFEKDLKQLMKKFRTLSDDLEVLKKNVIELKHIYNIDNQSTFEIKGFSTENISFWKIKKFACRSLKGRGANSGLRLIYAYDKVNRQAVFLELYFKADQANERKERIIKCLK